MKALALIFASATLGGCVSGATMRDGGVATYDAIRSATDACIAKGGTFKLKDGGDPKYLEDYACKKD